MLKKFLFTLSLITLLGPVNAARLEPYLIDTPTAKVAPVKTFSSTSRLFTDGGLLNYFTFTPFERFSIGTALTFEHLVGTNNQDIKVLPPSLQLKFQLFDGSETWPIIALGFDNQGFYFDHDKDVYLQKARGLYLSATREVFTDGLFLNAGLNVTTDGFEFKKLHGYGALNYNVADFLDFMFEWDNIRTLKNSRLNGGLRFFIAEFFALDIAIRNFNNKAERILQLKYTYTF